MERPSSKRSSPPSLLPLGLADRALDRGTPRQVVRVEQVTVKDVIERPPARPLEGAGRRVPVRLELGLQSLVHEGGRVGEILRFHDGKYPSRAGLA